MQGTRRAASSPVTPRKMPRRGIGIIITPEAAVSRLQPSEDSPSACRSSSSSSEIGGAVRRLRANRSARAHRPPIGRAATSSTKTPVALHAALGVNRSVAQAEGAGRLATAAIDRALRVVGRRRRREVDGLFEEWPVERIGLVEDREQLQGAVVHQPFERELAALDEPLDQRDVARLVALGPHVGRMQAARAAGGRRRRARPRRRRA